MLVNLRIQEKNWLTKSQNPATTLVRIIEMFVEILTLSLEVIEDIGAELAAVAIKEARLPIVSQLVKQTIPNLPSQVIIAKTPTSIATK